MRKVVKFGGSSLASAQQFEKVAEIVHAEASRRYVVPSAPGKRFRKDTKVTDMLYGCYALAEQDEDFSENLHQIEERYQEIIDGLSLTLSLEDEFAVIEKNFRDHAGKDYAASRGEYLNGIVMAAYLGYEFVDAAQVVFFKENGEFDAVKTNEVLGERLQNMENAVVPGFYGANPDGSIRTFSRGGSDITGSIVAKAVHADVYENWTDVSGFLIADPNIIPNPEKIETITYRELRELSYMGASVLHEESILPVKEKNIPLNIRNTNRPEDPGTMILERISGEEGDANRIITGIAGRRSFTVLTIYQKHIATDTRIIRKTLEMLETCRVEVEHITLGVDSFNLVMPTDQIRDRIYELIAEIKNRLQPDDVKVEDGIALIACVGRRMVSVPGSSAKLFGALGANNINIRMIAQGSEEISIIVGVDNKDFERTIRTLYDGFMHEGGSKA